MSKTYILHNNNAEKFSTNCQKKKLSYKESGDLSFFISNEFLNFSESVCIFSIFFTFFKIFKSESDWTKSCMAIAAIFFSKTVFI